MRCVRFVCDLCRGNVIALVTILKHYSSPLTSVHRKHRNDLSTCSARTTTRRLSFGLLRALVPLRHVDVRGGCRREWMSRPAREGRQLPVVRNLRGEARVCSSAEARGRSGRYSSTLSVFGWGSRVLVGWATGTRLFERYIRPSALVWISACSDAPLDYPCAVGEAHPIDTRTAAVGEAR